MRRHQIRNKILFLSDTLCYLVKTLLERLVRFYMRLSHFVKHSSRTMLRCNLQLTAYMMLYKLTDKLVVFILHKVVVSDSRTYENSLDTLDFSDFTKHFKVFFMVGSECGTRLRRKTFPAHAQSLIQLLFT